MSIKYVNRVLDLELTPVPKLVMAVLADNADDQGICWPRMSRIAARASVSERTAQRTKAKLVRQGLLKVSVRLRKDGSRMSDEYQLFPMDIVAGVNLPPPPPPSSVQHSTEGSPVGDSHGTPLTTTEPSVESPPQHTGLGGGGVNVEIPNCFQGAAQADVLRLISGLAPDVQQQLLDEVGENHKQQPTKTVPMRLLRYLSGLARQGQFRPELCFKAAESRSARRRAEDAAAKASPPRVEAAPEVVAAAKRKLAQIRGEIAGKGLVAKSISDVLASGIPGLDAIAEQEKK